jgi:hypothetical protein
MRWRTAHARHRRAERRLVEFQKAMDLYLMMVTYALLDEVVGGFLRRLVGEVAAMQDFMGLPAGGVIEPGGEPWPFNCEYVVPAGHPLAIRAGARACADARSAAIGPRRGGA